MPRRRSPRFWRSCSVIRNLGNCVREWAARFGPRLRFRKFARFVAALASVRSGAAGRVARTPFGLLPALPLGIPFAATRPCRWAGGQPGNLLRGGAAVASRAAWMLVASSSRLSPLARPHPSPLPEGEGTSSACQRSIMLTVRPWMASCPAKRRRGSEGYAKRERREQPEGRPGDATSGARADRSERGTGVTQIFQIVSADRSERGNAETQIFRKRLLD